MKQCISIIFLFSLAFNSLSAKDTPNILFYCGITMVKPMREISNIIEKQEHCIIKIIQGGSQDLYDSLGLSKIGDIYLPGSDAYIKKYYKEGFFRRSVFVGYNKAAIFVQKGNPKKVKGLKDLLNPNISTIICNPQSGSIGKNSKKILMAYGGKEFYEKVFDNAVEIGADSRSINKFLMDKMVDMAINWRASAFWKENRPYIDVIEIDEKFAPKKKLMLTKLSFSKHKKIVDKFLDYAVSKNGKEIMKKYGFR